MLAPVAVSVVINRLPVDSSVPSTEDRDLLPNFHESRRTSSKGWQ